MGEHVCALRISCEIPELVWIGPQVEKLVPGAVLEQSDTYREILVGLGPFKH